MYWSEVKLLLRYLIYNCDDAKTYIALALTCKYAAELARYYAPMKMREFCKEVKWGGDDLVGGKGTLYVLPNGRILRSKYSSCETAYQLPYTLTEYYDVKNNNVVAEEEESVSIYEKEIYYFLNNKEYSIENNFLSIEYKTGEKAHNYILNCSKCCYCCQYHIFYGYMRILDIHFIISSYCGLKLKYLCGQHAHEHEKRRKVVHAVIEYAKKMKEEK